MSLLKQRSLPKQQFNKMTTLTLVILDGKVLRDTQYFTDMKLYVKVFLKTATGCQQARTQAIKAGVDSLVSWNQRIVFQDPLIAPGAMLEFHIMDKDLIKDDDVVQGVADLAGCGILTPGVPNIYTIKLHYKNQYAGELRFESIYQ